MAKKETLSETIAYRVGAEAMKEITRQAAGQGLTPNEWCRQVVLEKVAERKKVQGQAGHGLASSTRQAVANLDAIRQSAPAPPAPPAQPTPAPNLGPIMNQNQAIFEEVLRLKFLIRQLALRYVEGNLTGQGWNFIDINTEGNMFREVAQKWAERYGIKIKH